jgi:V/A-type H+-transporting ATPase subunit K
MRKRIILILLVFGSLAINITLALAVFAQPVDQETKATPWGVIGAAIAFAAGALGTGLAQSRIGAAAMGAMAERPELLGNSIIMIAIPETVVILGFVIAIMLK